MPSPSPLVLGTSCGQCAPLAYQRRGPALVALQCCPSHYVLSVAQNNWSLLAFSHVLCYSYCFRENSCLPTWIFLFWFKGLSSSGAKQALPGSWIHQNFWVFLGFVFFVFWFFFSEVIFTTTAEVLIPLFPKLCFLNLDWGESYSLSSSCLKKGQPWWFRFIIFFPPCLHPTANLSCLKHLGWYFLCLVSGLQWY